MIHLNIIRQFILLKKKSTKNNQEASQSNNHSLIVIFILLPTDSYSRPNPWPFSRASDTPKCWSVPGSPETQSVQSSTIIKSFKFTFPLRNICLNICLNFETAPCRANNLDSMYKKCKMCKNVCVRTQFLWVDKNVFQMESGILVINLREKSLK